MVVEGQPKKKMRKEKEKIIALCVNNRILFHIALSGKYKKLTWIKSLHEVARIEIEHFNMMSIIRIGQLQEDISCKPYYLSGFKLQTVSLYHA